MNKTFLLGHVGKDPTIRTTNAGDSVASFSLATTERYKDKSGQKVEKTEWHNITAFSPLAEVIAKYVEKGSKLLIIGKLQTRKWTDKDGAERYTTEVVAKEMELLDGKSDRAGQAAESKPTPKAAQKTGGFDDFDGDIPF